MFARMMLSATALIFFGSLAPHTASFVQPLSPDRISALLISGTLCGSGVCKKDADCPIETRDVKGGGVSDAPGFSVWIDEDGRTPVMEVRDVTRSIQYIDIGPDGILNAIIVGNEPQRDPTPEEKEAYQRILAFVSLCVAEQATGGTI